MSYSLDAVKVHMVEDNSANLLMLTMLLCDVLEMQHYKGHRSGHELFAYIAAHPDQAPDVILLDLQLPQEDGYHVLDRVRTHPLIHSARVIACTAHVSRSNIVRAQAAGFDGFLAKPLEYGRFPDQMMRILAGEEVWDTGE
jgi:two-component system, cell cycle response regulator DivK